MKRGYKNIRKVAARYLFEKDPKKIAKNATVGLVVTPVPVAGTVYAIWCGCYYGFRKFVDSRVEHKREKEGGLIKLIEAKKIYKHRFLL